MSFRTKAEQILPLLPDILILPECETTEKIKFSLNNQPTSSLWFGNNPHKGLAVFSFGKYTLKVLDDYNDNFKIIIPIKVYYENLSFYLFAIWAKENDDGGYIIEICKAIEYYNEILNKSSTILVGDFNSNTIWDYKRNYHNHSSLVKFLEQNNIFSTYHTFYNQTQGKEVDATLYMYRHNDKPYHIDYCFASSDLLAKLKYVEIGNFEQWINFSDHMPLIVDFSIP